MPPQGSCSARLKLDVLQYVSDRHPISVRVVAEYFAETTGRAPHDALLPPRWSDCARRVFCDAER